MADARGPAAPNISKEKLKAFSVGIHKKSAFHKQKEAEEARRKREEEDAARIFEEFAASFEADADNGGTWVKASSTPSSSSMHGSGPRPGDIAASAAVAAAPGASDTASRLYKPSPRIVQDPDDNSSSTAIKAASSPWKDSLVSAPESTSILAAAADGISEKEAHTPAQPGQKRRNLDTFLEELKRENAASGGAAGKRQRAADQPAPAAEPVTTNVYIGNMAMDVTEKDLCNEFGVFGPIGSVKVMVPRTIEEHERGYKWGFVLFMNREDAAAALRTLNGRELRGNPMHLDWGKMMPLPPAPVYEMSEEERMRRRPAFIARLKERGGNGGKASDNTAGDFEDDDDNGAPRIHVIVPTDPIVLARIHQTIQYTLEYGPKFEAMLMLKEKDSPDYAFLFETESAEHRYYRWKAYSLMQGDSISRWSMRPFVMIEGQPKWVPPNMPFEDAFHPSDGDASSLDDSDSDHSVARPRSTQASRGPLPNYARRRFERYLRHASLDRQKIAKAMVFCITHAEAAQEILEILTSSLLIERTPIFPTKFSRLYLLSDILHNSSATVPNAWRYRALLQNCLPRILTHFGSVWKSTASRLRAEQMRRSVMTLLAIWESWLIFPSTFVDQLREAFTRGSQGKIETNEAGGGNRVGGAVVVEKTNPKKQDASTLQAHSGIQDEKTIESKFIKSKFAPIGPLTPLTLSSMVLPTKSAQPNPVVAFNSAGSSNHNDAFMSTPGSTQNTKVDEEKHDDDDSDDDDDLDGVPLTLTTSAPSGANKHIHQSMPQHDEEEDDDLDGVPIQLGTFGSKLHATASINSNSRSVRHDDQRGDDAEDDDESLDGVPLQPGYTRLHAITAHPIGLRRAAGRNDSDHSDNDDMFGK